MERDNWIGHILRRNCLLQQVIEGKIKGQIEVTRRRGTRRNKLLDDLKDRRGYCQLKDALDRTMWRNRFGRGFGPVVWQITDDDDLNNIIFIDNNLGPLATESPCILFVVNLKVLELNLNFHYKIPHLMEKINIMLSAWWHDTQCGFFSGNKFIIIQTEGYVNSL